MLIKGKPNNETYEEAHRFYDSRLNNLGTREDTPCNRISLAGGIGTEIALLVDLIEEKIQDRQKVRQDRFE